MSMCQIHSAGPQQESRMQEALNTCLLNTDAPEDGSLFVSELPHWVPDTGLWTPASTCHSPACGASVLSQGLEGRSWLLQQHPALSQAYLSRGVNRIR